MWVLLGILSSFFLGMYDISKKRALKDNAVLPVLFLSTVAGLVLMLPCIILSHFVPDQLVRLDLYVPKLPPIAHLHLFLKALIVSSSWVFAYFSLKHLPISIATPIRATGPVWTLLGALMIFNERLSLGQWLGLAVVLISFYAFSRIGHREGISFQRNKWVFFIFLATLIGTASSLYDKFLLHNLNYSPMAVQAWFAVYLVAVLGLVIMFFWWPARDKTTPFRWHWSIAMIGVLLIVADFVYFRALDCDDALITLLSALRRCSVVFSFGLGAIIFKELNKRRKALALAGVLLGVFLILFSTNHG